MYLLCVLQKKEAKKRRRDKATKEDSSKPQKDKKANAVKGKDGDHQQRQRQPSIGQSTEGEESCSDNEVSKLFK